MEKPIIDKMAKGFAVFIKISLQDPFCVYAELAFCRKASLTAILITDTGITITIFAIEKKPSCSFVKIALIKKMGILLAMVLISFAGIIYLGNLENTIAILLNSFQSQNFMRCFSFLKMENIHDNAEMNLPVTSPNKTPFPNAFGETKPKVISEIETAPLFTDLLIESCLNCLFLTHHSL